MSAARTRPRLTADLVLWLSIMVCGAFLVSLLAVGRAAAAPVRVLPPQPEKEAEAAPLTGQTNWGYLTQTGCELTLAGNQTWEAAGHIRPDGKVYFLWLHLGSGETAQSVYELRGKIVGLWGYTGQVEILPNGQLTGAVRDDVIQPAPPVPAPPVPAPPDL